MKKTKNYLLIIVMIMTIISCTKEDFDTNLYVKSTTVFEGISPAEWEEIDISKAVGTNYAMATLKISTSDGLMAYFRQKGDKDDYTFGSATVNMVSLGPNGIGQTTIYTNNKGLIEWKASQETNVKIEVVAFVK